MMLDLEITVRFKFDIARNFVEDLYTDVKYLL
jgi:hypothetical protein